MKKVISYIVTIVILLFMSGCATTLVEGPPFTKAAEPSKSQGLVYLYRPHSPPFWRSPTVYINNIEIFDLGNKGYSYVYLKPGSYNVTVDWGADTGMADINGYVNVEAGKSYYIRLHGDLFYSSTRYSSKTELAGIRKSDALRELSNCLYIKPVNSGINTKAATNHIINAKAATGDVASPSGDSNQSQDFSELFNNKTFDGYHNIKKRSFTRYFSSDGKLISLYEFGVEREGRWWVNNQQLCIRWEHNDKLVCFKISADGDNVKLLGKKQGKLRMTLSQPKAGNHI